MGRAIYSFLKKSKTLPMALSSIAVLLVGGFFLGRVSNFNHEQFPAALSRFSYLDFLIAFSFVLLQVGFQVQRLRYLFKKIIRPTFVKAGYAYTLGQVLNAALAARAGDLAKIFQLKTSQKNKNDLAASEVAGVIVADRVSDGLSLLVWVLVAGGLSQATAFSWVMDKKFISVGILILVIPAVLYITYLLFKEQYPRAMHSLRKFLKGLSSLSDRKRITKSLFWGLLDRSCELFVIYILCASLGYWLGLEQLVFVLFVLNLGIAIPISIANIGTFEAAMSFALHQAGIPVVEAISIATIHHFGQLIGVGFPLIILSLLKKAGRFKLSFADQPVAS